MAISGFAIGACSIIIIPMVGGIISGRKYVKKNGAPQKTPEEKRTNVANTFLALISLGSFIGAIACFFADKKASGIVCIGIFAAMVVIIAIVNSIASYRYKNTNTGTTGGVAVTNDEGVEIDTFDLYCDADDVFEEYRTGAGEEYLDADSFEEMLNEADEIYDRYMLDDTYHGNSEGELLYAEKILELVVKYNKIIATKNPEYNSQSLDKAGDDYRQVTEKVEKVTALIDKYKRVKFGETPAATSEKTEKDLAPLCDVLEKVAQKKSLEEQKKSPRNADFSDFTRQITQKPYFSLNNNEVELLRSATVEPEKPSVENPDSNEKVEDSIKSNGENIQPEKTVTRNKNSRTTHATVGYKGIKKSD